MLTSININICDDLYINIKNNTYKICETSIKNTFEKKNEEKDIHLHPSSIKMVNHEQKISKGNDSVFREICK